MTLSLSADQQRGYDALCQFVFDPAQSVFVLRGHSGTGKTTLVSHCIEQYPTLIQSLRLLQPNLKQEYEITLTATTNKAAEALSLATGQAVRTIHSLLGLRVQTDFRTGQQKLSVGPRAEVVTDLLLFIDEASYIDKHLLSLIYRQTRRCKIVFMGDPHQLLAVGASTSPVFDAGYPEARLEKVIRQAEGNPIIDFSAMCRGTVAGGEWFSFQPDGHHIRHVERDEFERLVVDEFTRPDWKQADSRVLTWTNRQAIVFNKGIAGLKSGSPDFQKGDYAVCNSFVRAGSHNIKTDQLVQITDISDPFVLHGAHGRKYTLNKHFQLFMPDSLEERKRALKRAQEAEDTTALIDIQEHWIDLREAYASTINKAQGSTYTRVYIDLTDLKKCRQGNQLARLLYVAASRAREQVIFTGDLA